MELERFLLWVYILYKTTARFLRVAGIDLKIEESVSFFEISTCDLIFNSGSETENTIAK